MKRFINSSTDIAGQYRALFTVEKDRVIILHIRRGTMDKAAESDLFG